jgi:hypothetical protein
MKKQIGNFVSKQEKKSFWQHARQGCDVFGCRAAGLRALRALFLGRGIAIRDSLVFGEEPAPAELR